LTAGGCPSGGGGSSRGESLGARPHPPNSPGISPLGGKPQLFRCFFARRGLDPWGGAPRRALVVGESDADLPSPTSQEADRNPAAHGFEPTFRNLNHGHNGRGLAVYKVSDGTPCFE